LTKNKAILFSLVSTLAVYGSLCAATKITESYKHIDDIIKNLTRSSKDEDPKALLAEYAAAYRLPLELVTAVAKMENLKDWENNDAVSTKGALGIMQVIPKYHIGKGKTCDGIVSNWTELVGKANRRNNIHCGVKVLRSCVDSAMKSRMNTEDKIELAIMTYNNSRAYAKSVVYTALAERLGGV